MKLTTRIMMAGAMMIAAPTALATSAAAQSFPLVLGEYTTVTGIHVEDGGTLAYAQFLAGQWVKEREFAKSKGWISDYKMYVNVDARDGEPDVYLTYTFATLPNAAESEKRDAEYGAWAKKSDAQLDAEAGNRAKFRKIASSMLLQEFTARK